MSGDIGLRDEPILFYNEEMTPAKLILLKYKGINYNLYSRVIRAQERINKEET